MKNTVFKIISASLTACILTTTLLINSFGYEFEDINYHWARDDIQKLVDAGVFTGITQNRFEPDADVTRGMIAVVICHILNVDPGDRVAFFKDVDNNRYYAPYIAWAYEKQILTGYSDMTFRAETPVTRQEMFCIIERVMKFENQNLDLSSDFELAYADTDQIADYALEAVRYLSDKGYIHGNDENMIKPNNNTTRAEFCAIAAKVMGLSELSRPEFPAENSEEGNKKDDNVNSTNNTNNANSAQNSADKETEDAKSAFKNHKSVAFSYKDDKGEEALTVIYSTREKNNVCHVKFSNGIEIYIEDATKTVYEKNKGRLITYINALDSYDKNIGNIFDSDFGKLDFLNSYIADMELNDKPEISYYASDDVTSFLSKFKSQNERDVKVYTVKTPDESYSEDFSINKDCIVMLLDDDFQLFTDENCENEFKSSDYIGNNKSLTLYISEKNS